MARDRKQDVGLEQNRAEAVRMRVAGFTIRDIAQAMGRPRSTVQDWITRACTLARQEQYDRADQLRTEQAMALDLLQRRWFDKALDGDGQAAEIVLKVIRERCKIFALNLPEETNVNFGETLRVEFVGALPPAPDDDEDGDDA